LTNQTSPRASRGLNEPISAGHAQSPWSIVVGLKYASLPISQTVQQKIPTFSLLLTPKTPDWRGKWAEGRIC